MVSLFLFALSRRVLVNTRRSAEEMIQDHERVSIRFVAKGFRQH